MSWRNYLMDFFNLFYTIKTWRIMLDDDRKNYIVDVMSKMDTIKDNLILCFDIFEMYVSKNGDYIKGDKIFTVEINATEKMFSAYRYSFCKHSGDITNFKEILLTEHNLRDVFDLIMAFEKDILPKLKKFKQETYEMHLIKYGY